MPLRPREKTIQAGLVLAIVLLTLIGLASLLDPATGVSVFLIGMLVGVIVGMAAIMTVGLIRGHTDDEDCVDTTTTTTDTTDTTAGDRTRSRAGFDPAQDLPRTPVRDTPLDVTDPIGLTVIGDDVTVHEHTSTGFRRTVQLSAADVRRKYYRR